MTDATHTDTPTPAQEVVRELQDERAAIIALHVERIITELELLNVTQDKVQKHRDGLRIPLDVQPWYPRTVYIYAFPWSRGWSIYVSDDHEAYCHNWSSAPSKLKDFQRPLYTPRDLVGAQNIDPAAIAYRMAALRLSLWDRADGARVRNANKITRAQFWYWPRSVAAHLKRKEPYVAPW